MSTWSSDRVTMDTSLRTTNVDVVDDNSHNITLQLKEEIQVICEKLASYGEESVFISTNKIENTSSFRGSKFGQDFILKRLQIIDQFYNSCMGYATDLDDYDECKKKIIEPSTEKRETNKAPEIGTRPFIPSSTCTSLAANYQPSILSQSKSINISERCYDVGDTSNIQEKGESSDCDEGVGFEMYISPEVASLDKIEQNKQFDESDKIETGLELAESAVKLSDELQHNRHDSDMECSDHSEITNENDSIFDKGENSNDSEMNNIDNEGNEKERNSGEMRTKVQVNTKKLKMIDDDDGVGNDDDDGGSDDDDDDVGGGCGGGNDDDDDGDDDWEEEEVEEKKKYKIQNRSPNNRNVKTKRNVQIEKASHTLKTINTNSMKLRSKFVKSDKVNSQTTQTADFEVDTPENINTEQKAKLGKLSLKDDGKTSGAQIVLISGARPNQVKKLKLTSARVLREDEIKTKHGKISKRTQKSGIKSTNKSLKSTSCTVKQLSDCEEKTEQNDVKTPETNTDMSLKKLFLVRKNKQKDKNKIIVKNNTRTAKLPIEIKKEEERIPDSASIVYPDGHVEQVPVETKKKPCDTQDECDGKIMTQGEKKSYFLFLNNKTKDQKEIHKDNDYMSYKDNAHLCNVCGKIYKHKKNLKDHMFKHSGDYPFSCPLCDRKFPKKGPMQTHLNNHLEYKMFMCEFCGKRFASSGLLGEHRKVHREGKPYACRVCDKRFPRKTYLTKHMKFHKENKEYMCEECGKRFFTSTHLKRHYLIHTGVKQYRCTLCPYECNQSGNLKIHMKVHKRDLE